MTQLEEMKVEAYKAAVSRQEDIIRAYENRILAQDGDIKLPTLMEYRKSIVKVERYYNLIREITGEEF